jgi:hypothetical protein
MQPVLEEIQALKTGRVCQIADKLTIQFWGGHTYFGCELSMLSSGMTLRRDGQKKSRPEGVGRGPAGCQAKRVSAEPNAYS